MTAQPRKKATKPVKAPEPVKVPEPPVASDADRIRDISEAVFRERLGSDAKSMIEKDGDDGKKLRARAGAFDSLTRVYLKVLKQAGAD
jgi:hypothetical protein